MVNAGYAGETTIFILAQKVLGFTGGYTREYV